MVEKNLFKNSNDVDDDGIVLICTATTNYTTTEKAPEYLIRVHIILSRVRLTHHHIGMKE